METAANGRETLSGEPFLDISNAQKDPLTTYAIDNSTLVAYVPIADIRSRTMLANHKLAITLIDYWSRDAYVWSVLVPDEIEYEHNRIYTLDLTYMEPDIAIEAIAYKHTVLDWPSKPFGYVRTKNIGSATPADEGFFYLFGHEERIYPDRHYPSYPRNAPYFYLESEKGDLATLSSKDLVLHANSAKKYYCAYSTSAHAMIVKYTETEGVLPTTDLGALWSSVLKEQFNTLHKALDGWTLPVHGSSPVFQLNNANYYFYTTQMVNSLGQTATDESEVAGMRMTIDRTGHVLYFPACGMLEPSSTNVENNVPYIEHDAVAQRTTAYGNVVFMQDNLQIVTNNGKREAELMLNSFDFDPTCPIGNGKPVRRTAPLCVATTVRPVYNLYSTDLNTSELTSNEFYTRFPIVLMRSTKD